MHRKRTKRLLILAVLFMMLFSAILIRLFWLQIVHGKDYLDTFTYRIQKDTKTTAKRGNIYDCNGQLLAGSKVSYNVIIESSLLPEENTQKNTIIYELLKLIKRYGVQLKPKIPIIIDDSGLFQFTGTHEEIVRFKKDIFNLNSDDKLDSEKEAMDAKAMVAYLCSPKMFDIQGYSNEDTLSVAAVRYALYMKRYTEYLSVVAAEDVSAALMAAVMENETQLPGISVEKTYRRFYEDSPYFSHITGYVSTISYEELQAMNKEDKDYYDSDDIIGKTGLEQVYESELSGTKGEKTTYVNSMGTPLKTYETKASLPGKDIYLSIDKELQKTAYDLLEEKTAGILLSRMVETVDPKNNPNWLIPIHDVYYALIENQIIHIEDIETMAQSSEPEKKLYAVYSKYLQRTMAALDNFFNREALKPDDISDDEQAFCSYIYEWIESNGLLKADAVNADDPMLSKFQNGEITVFEFLRYASANEYIDTSRLLSENGASWDKNKIYHAVYEKIIDELPKDSGFQAIIYKQMLADNSISPNVFLQLLYTQDVLDEDEDYKKLQDNTISGYDFIYNKIYELKLTPDMLGLTPCSGICIVTDVTDGSIKAYVSYPGYDANQIYDAGYYSSLLSKQSKPLYDRAAGQLLAPGSTFKIISAAAGLEEGYITPKTKIYDKVIFDKISPSASCWSKMSHGSVNVSEALSVSCNYFFYELGYRLSLMPDKTVNHDKGLKVIHKYASMFGLDKKSGIELYESEPSVSDENAILSMIGQGTHSYTPVVLARYMTAVANKGTLYPLSLVDKISSSDGTHEVAKEKKAEKIKLSESTWKAIYKGLYGVCQSSSYHDLFTSLSVSTAGKSGTAQERSDRPDHSLFIGFAPYENPRYCVTVIIPNGYGSANVVDVFRDVTAACFGLPLYTRSDGQGRHASLPYNYSNSQEYLDYVSD